MNNFILKITGTSELSEPLSLGEDYSILIKGNITSITKRDDNDGDISYLHTIKQLTAEIHDSYGKKIEVKDKTKQSAKLRGQIMIEAEREGKNAQEEYDKQMTKIRHFYPEIKEFIKTLEMPI